MVRIPREIAKRVEDYAAKYMGILEVAGERPTFKAVDSPGSGWYGRTHPVVEVDEETGSLEGINTQIELQKQIFNKGKHLERVVAHELVHHRDLVAPFSTLTAEQKAKAEAALAVGDHKALVSAMGWANGDEPHAPKAHGPTFHEGAARINAVMGPFFVHESIEALPEDKRTTGTTRSSPNRVLLFGLGGLAALVWALVLRRKMRSDGTLREPAHRKRVPPAEPVVKESGVMRSMPSRSPAQPARENERGRYGIPPRRPAQSARENGRGNYAKK